MLMMGLAARRARKMKHVQTHTDRHDSQSFLGLIRCCAQQRQAKEEEFLLLLLYYFSFPSVCLSVPSAPFCKSKKASRLASLATKAIELACRKSLGQQLVCLRSYVRT